MRNKINFKNVVSIVIAFSIMCSQAAGFADSATHISGKDKQKPNGIKEENIVASDAGVKSDGGILSDGSAGSDGVINSDASVNSDSEIPSSAADFNREALIFKDEHLPYMKGTGGVFRPEAALTRAEFCKILNSVAILDDKGYGAKFSDVTDDKWYYDAINVCVKAGVINGYANGAFKPDAFITRAEFVTVISGNNKMATSDAMFYDTVSHWAKDSIAYAASKGYVGGYDDGSFNPDGNISRAEAAVIMNRVLSRTAANSIELIGSHTIAPYCDVKDDAWYYMDVLEAAVEHSVDESADNEIWVDFSYGDFPYKDRLVWANNKYYITDGNGQFPSWTPGSFVNSGGKTYYINVYGDVETASIGPVAIGDELYCFNSDYSILKDANYHMLYFDADGKYSCGNAEVDAMVDAALAKCTTPDMTKEQKLKSAYLYIRDNNRYLSRPHQKRGIVDFAYESASFMFTHNRGNCYCFASCFLFMARKIGYSDATIVSGGVGTRNDDHAWVMIGDRIFDVELEYAYRYRYAVKKYYNLYNMARNEVPFPYIFPY